MYSFIYFILAGAALHTQIHNWSIPNVHFFPIRTGRNNGNPCYTKKYADNHQKAKRNRPYYGHRNHKYVIPHKNRK